MVLAAAPTAAADRGPPPTAPAPEQDFISFYELTKSASRQSHQSFGRRGVAPVASPVSRDGGEVTILTSQPVAYIASNERGS